MKKGYKKTDIGVIPKDWEVKKLGDCLSKNPDYGINAAAVDYTDTLPTYLRITDISDDGNYISKNRVSVSHKLSDFYFLEEGDIVFARTGASVGKTYLYNIKDGKLVFAGFLIRIKPNIKILNPAFLKFHTQTKYYWNWVISHSMRSGQPGLNSNEYKSFKIPLPPLPEQKAIAEVLSDTDNLIRAFEKRMAKKRLIKQGAMQKLLTPEDWEIKKLGEIGECIIGLTYSPDNVKDSGKLVLRSSNIQGSVLRFDNNVFVDIQIPEKLIVKKNDVLICVRNGSRNLIGKCALIGGGRAVGETFGAFMSVFRSPFNEFVFIVFQSSIIKKQIDEHLGATINQITNKSLNSFEIPFPPKKQQTHIATILSDMDSEIEALEKKRAKYKQLKQGLMQNLLTGKIRLI
jgi:type I restriction enzyme S subunit